MRGERARREALDAKAASPPCAARPGATARSAAEVRTRRHESVLALWSTRLNGNAQSAGSRDCTFETSASHTSRAKQRASDRPRARKAAKTKGPQTIGRCPEGGAEAEPHERTLKGAAPKVEGTEQVVPSRDGDEQARSGTLIRTYFGYAFSATEPTSMNRSADVSQAQGRRTPFTQAEVDA